jgi:FKBP-type peptidyl-prolyl cis-trans isomerase FkpA
MQSFLKTLSAVALAGLVSVPMLRAAEPTTDDEKALYALGLSIGRSVDVFQLTPAELEMVKQGLTDQITGQKAKVELETFGPKIQQLARARGMARAEKEKKTGQEFLDKAAAQAGAKKTASGLVYIPEKEGTGASPAATDTVSVHYRGTLIDGKEFDSSHKRGQPAQFALNQVIPGWTEGLQLMKPGGKAKLVIPSALGYGDRGSPPNIPGGSTLQFEVELLEVVKKTAPEKSPVEATTPPVQVPPK